jgi:hypothetical protein
VHFTRINWLHAGRRKAQLGFCSPFGFSRYSFDMVSFKFILMRILTVISAAPLFVDSTAAAPATDLVERNVDAVQAAPHWVTYTDRWITGENGPPAVSSLSVCSSLAAA